MHEKCTDSALLRALGISMPQRSMLIDTFSLCLIDAPAGTSYAALSYKWGVAVLDHLAWSRKSQKASGTGAFETPLHGARCHHFYQELRHSIPLGGRIVRHSG